MPLLSFIILLSRVLRPKVLDVSELSMIHTPYSPIPGVSRATDFNKKGLVTSKFISARFLLGFSCYHHGFHSKVKTLQWARNPGFWPRNMEEQARRGRKSCVNCNWLWIPPYWLCLDLRKWERSRGSSDQENWKRKW